MKPTPMKVEAMLFASKGLPTYKKAADGTPQMTVRAVHRIGTHQVEAWTLVLTGDQARHWWDRRAELKPGTPLAVHANQLRAHAVAGFTEIVASVTELRLMLQTEKAPA